MSEQTDKPDGKSDAGRKPFRKIVVLYMIGGSGLGLLFSICAIAFRLFCNVPMSPTELLLGIKFVVVLVAMGTVAGIAAGLAIALIVGLLQR